MWWAGVAWRAGDFEVAVVDDTGNEVVPAREFTGRQLHDLIALLPRYAAGGGPHLRRRATSGLHPAGPGGPEAVRRPGELLLRRVDRPRIPGAGRPYRRGGAPGRQSHVVAPVPAGPDPRRGPPAGGRDQRGAGEGGRGWQYAGPPAVRGAYPAAPALARRARDGDGVVGRRCERLGGAGYRRGGGQGDHRGHPGFGGADA